MLTRRDLSWRWRRSLRRMGRYPWALVGLGHRVVRWNTLLHQRSKGVRK